MANESKQLTVADLEAAKTEFSSIAKELGDHSLSKYEDIAATCIGIVEEMVKCQWPNADDPNDEIAQLKAWLEAVVKECTQGKWTGQTNGQTVSAKIQHNTVIDSILRAACGEGGAV